MWGFFRLMRATRIFLTILFSYLLQLGLRKVFGAKRGWIQRRWERVHARNARRLYRTMVRLRGVYIKLGQILSIMGTFLPRVYTKELEKLQDKVPARPYRVMAAALEKGMGAAPDELFESFDREPLAAASLAQVHRARTKQGDDVAVKILYPNVAAIIAVDMRILGWAMRVYRWFFPIRHIERVHEQLQDLLTQETDLTHERRSLVRMAGNFDDDPDALFPTPYPELSCRTVMTMSFMEGVKISRLDLLDELCLDPEAVATKLVQMFYKQLFFDRFFHADPHPGNFFVQCGPEGQPRIVSLDFGAASVVEDNLVDGMLDILSGLMGRNDELVVRGVETMGFVAPDGNRELLNATIRKYFAKLLDMDITDFGHFDMDQIEQLVDPEVKRAELRELMKAVEYPLGFFYVERAIILLFGLCAHIAPKLNTVLVGFPYIMQFLKEHPLPSVPLSELK